MVMGGDSCSKVCEFKTQHRVLDGHFFRHLFDSRTKSSPISLKVAHRVATAVLTKK